LFPHFVLENDMSTTFDMFDYFSAKKKQKLWTYYFIVQR